jgi:hypothetical protein
VKEPDRVKNCSKRGVLLEVEGNLDAIAIPNPQPKPPPTINKRRRKINERINRLIPEDWGFPVWGLTEFLGEDFVTLFSSLQYPSFKIA